MGKIKLMEVVQSYIDSADLSVHFARRLYNIARRGAREFNMDITGQFKSVLLPVSANGTIAFPDDYLQYSKIGILNGLGEVMTLKHNEDLTTLHQGYLTSINQVTPVPQAPGFGAFTPTQFPLIWYNFCYGGGPLYHLYGIGGGTSTIGEFTIDDANRCFLLQTGWPYDSLILEYLSDGYDCDCGDYMVDIRASEAMIAYIRWKNAQDLRKKFGTRDVQYFRNEFYRERNIAKLRINMPNVNEMQTVFRSNVKLTARA